MKIAIVFEPDEELGSDENDPAHEARSLGLFIDAAQEDVILVHRRFGDQYEGGVRTQLFSTGIWESVTIDQLREAIAVFEELE